MTCLAIDLADAGHLDPDLTTPLVDVAYAAWRWRFVSASPQRSAAHAPHRGSASELTVADRGFLDFLVSSVVGALGGAGGTQHDAPTTRPRASSAARATLRTRST
jgi:hypothetical protein